MIGIEKAYCNTAIQALIRASHTLLDSTIDDALQKIPVWKKGDTLGLDAKPEITIAEHLKKFDQHAILITEERGEDENPLAKITPGHERGARTFFVSDPTDRSSQLRKFLLEFQDTLPNKNEKESAKVSQAIERENVMELWQNSQFPIDNQGGCVDFGSPVRITGACSAITCVRRGLPICSALLNYITQELVVACSAGIYSFPIPSIVDRSEQMKIDLDVIIEADHRIKFGQIEPPDERKFKKFVTFFGKEGYIENFRDSRLVREAEWPACLHYRLPGGPSRIMYLSDFQPENEKIGFVVANGEKIGEWIHWLPFVRFAKMSNDLGERALRVFEIFQDRPSTRDGILMSTSPIYSAFKEVDDIQHRMLIDVTQLKTLPNPSKYRSTLIVAPTLNVWAMQLVQQYGHRPIEFQGD